MFAATLHCNQSTISTVWQQGMFSKYDELREAQWPGISIVSSCPWYLNFVYISSKIQSFFDLVNVRLGALEGHRLAAKLSESYKFQEIK